MHRWTRKELRFIERHYPKYSQRKLLEKLNKRFSLRLKWTQLMGCLKNHCIVSGRTGCFEKGHAPANKGTKGLMKANSGTFQKGRIPANYKPIGHERVDINGYVWIKVAERNPYTGFPERYREKHIVIWEKTHGPVPPKSAIIFKDGNRKNFKFKNLECVSQAVLLRLNKNRYGSYPKKLKPSVLAMSKLEVKTFKLQKNIKKAKKSSTRNNKRS